MRNCVLSHGDSIIFSKLIGSNIGLTTTVHDYAGPGNNSEPIIKGLMEAVGADKCVQMLPNHGINIRSFLPEDVATKPVDADGIVYGSESVGFIGFFHCSRATLSREILREGLKQLLFWSMKSVRDIQAIIYQGICASCYEVGADVLEEFTQGENEDETKEKQRRYLRFFLNGKKPGKYQLDLLCLIQQKLLNSGIAQPNIRTIELCSHHHRFCDLNRQSIGWNIDYLLSSYRRAQQNNEPDNRNFIYAKLPDDNTVITGLTGNCPYVILKIPLARR